MTGSKLVSRQSRYAGQAVRALTMQANVASRKALGYAIDGIRETARINSYTVPTDVLSAADAGDGTSTITMAAHTRVYPVEGAIDVPDLVFPDPVDLLGAPLETEGYVYYDDVTLLDTAPDLVFTEDQAEAQSGHAAGRHFVGKITTPAAGGAATGGSGPLPPGGGGGTAIP